MADHLKGVSSRSVTAVSERCRKHAASSLSLDIGRAERPYRAAYKREIKGAALLERLLTL
jgi:hypothetical protein